MMYYFDTITFTTNHHFYLLYMSAFLNFLPIIQPMFSYDFSEVLELFESIRFEKTKKCQRAFNWIKDALMK